MKEDQMVPSCSYFPPNQTQRLLADLMSSTHTPLHRALCSRPRLPCSHSPDLMPQLLANPDGRAAVSQKHIILYRGWPTGLCSPPPQDSVLFYISQTVWTAWQFVCLKASKILVQKYTQRAENCAFPQQNVWLMYKLAAYTSVPFIPLSLLSYACSLHIQHFSAPISSQINRLLQITFPAFNPVLLHPHPSLLFLRDWREDYRFGYVNVLWNLLKGRLSVLFGLWS